MDVQMLPMEHLENCISPSVATGLMMNCEFESQVSVVSGQHELVLLHPLVHCTPVSIYDSSEGKKILHRAKIVPIH